MDDICIKFDYAEFIRGVRMGKAVSLDAKVNRRVTRITALVKSTIGVVSWVGKPSTR